MILHTHTLSPTHTSLSLYIHTYIPTSVRPSIHPSIHTYIHTHTYIPTYYIPTYLHTYIPTYLHTYIPTSLHPTPYIPTSLHPYILHPYIPTSLHPYIPTSPTSLHPYIPTSLHPYIPTSLHPLPPYIPTSLHPYIPTSLHPYIPTSLHPYIPTSLHPYIPTSLHPYIPTSLHPYHPSIHPYINTYNTESIISSFLWTFLPPWRDPRSVGPSPSRRVPGPASVFLTFFWPFWLKPPTNPMVCGMFVECVEWKHIWFFKECVEIIWDLLFRNLAWGHVSQSSLLLLKWYKLSGKQESRIFGEPELHFSADVLSNPSIEMVWS